MVVTSTPEERVQFYGAPAQVWYNIRSPGEDDRLLMDVLVHSQGHRDTCTSRKALCRALTVESCTQEALGSFEVVVVTSMPEEQVQYYGAPAQVWYNIRSPGEDDRLLMDILWVNKTATRLPEVSTSPTA